MTLPADGPPQARRRFAPEGELANVITHGLGLVAAALATLVLVVIAATRGDAWEVVGVSVFGASMIALYGASTLYHATDEPRRKARMEILDHAGIYLLIAGTYTPFMIGDLRGGWGWSLFGVIWGLAVVGTIAKLFFIGRFKLFSTLVYIGMGWLVVIAIGPMIQALSGMTLFWLVAGGVAYTAGTPFFHNERMRHSHAIWHLFVIMGSVCHAIAVGAMVWRQGPGQ